MVLLDIRARDVLTTHHPLIGTSSSAALGNNILLNHPGPLLFDLLALPVKLLPYGAGLAVGVGLINATAGSVAVVFGRRQRDITGALIVALGFAALAWSAGAASLYDPYNPTVAMLPCFACLVLAWSCLNGDDVAMPWLLGASSFCIQTNNAYIAFLVPLLFIVVAERTWRARLVAGSWKPARVLAVVRSTAIQSAVVLLVLWAQPLVEQVSRGRDGNLALMLRATRYVSSIAGPELGTQVAASVLSRPPLWLRSGFNGRGVVPGIFEPHPSIVVAVISLVALCTVLTMALIWSRRRGDHVTANALALALVAAAIGWLAAIRIPVSPFFGLTADYVRWLWPIGAFCAVALTLSIASAIRPRLSATARMVGLAGAFSVLTLVTILNLPYSENRLSRESTPLIPANRELARQTVQSLATRSGPVFYHAEPGQGDAFSPSVISAIQRSGIEFLVADPILLRQFGSDRQFNGQVSTHLELRLNFRAIEVAGDETRIAFTSALTNDELNELGEITDVIAVALGDGDIEVSEFGRTLIGTPFAPTWFNDIAAGIGVVDGPSIVASIEFVELGRAGAFAFSRAIEGDAQRYLDLSGTLILSTAAIFDVTQQDGTGS
jgi:hypothetical protein